MNAASSTRRSLKSIVAVARFVRSMRFAGRNESRVRAEHGRLMSTERDAAKVVLTHPSGEVEETFLPPSDYLVLTGPQRYIDGVQVYRNGTVVVTIKRHQDTR